MSYEITTAFVKQYHSNIEILSQQKGSRLRPKVRVETDIKGKEAFYDQIGATAAQKKTTRHGDTPLIHTPHARRRIRLYDYEWADLIDDLDKVKTLTDPESPYVQNAVNAHGRSMDDELIAAATATAYVGEDGATPIALPGTQIVLHASSGLTVAKLRAAKKIFLQNEIDLEQEKLYICVSADELDDLLGDSQVTSADYNTVKALVKGEVNTFMGFEFVHSERLSEISSVRKCIAWAESGLLLGVGVDVKVKVSERADKSYAIQPYCSMSIGATRMDENKVVEIQAYHA
jgi:hypothetical protein